MERHIDTRDHDEGSLAAADLAASLDLLLEGLQGAHRTGDRILRSAQVEVDDLEEFPCALSDLGHECGDVGVVEIDLRGPDGGQSVVGAALLITRHDVVHLAAAVEHHLQQCLQFVDTGDTGQCGVLPDRVAAGDRAFDERTLLAHLGHLGRGHCRHGHLGELGQVQHALGVLIVHATGDQTGRVVADHVQHREAKGVASERIRAVPYLAGGLGPGPHIHTHALVLNTLAGEGVHRLRRRQPRGRRHHHRGADPGGDLQNLCTQVDPDPVDPEIDLISGGHHPEEAGGPADQLARRDRLSVGGRHHVLGGCREPHAVHDRSRQAGEQRCGPVGVNRVVIAGDDGERPHVDRRGDGDVPATSTRGVGGVLRYRSPGAHRIAKFARAGATADGEALLEYRQNRPGGIADVHRDRHHPADLGVESHRRRCGHDQLGVMPRQWLEQLRGVIQMHQAQQALDNRETGVGDRAADCGEHRWPAPTDQSVGHRRKRGCQRRTECRGDAGVIGDPFGIPLHGCAGRSAD